MEYHRLIILDISRAETIEILEAHQGDKNSRYIDIMLASDGETISLSENVTAKYDAVINNIVAAEDELAEIKSEDNIITVTADL